jgi:osmotically-inducible protein OsmY
VTVRNGFVIVKGNVPNFKVRDDVIEFIRSIPGVIEVINQIALYS